MDDLRQSDGVNNPDQTKSFEQWVIRQFQGQDFFPDIQPAKNANEGKLVFVSPGGDTRFTVECIWKKMLSGPWKWTAIHHQSGKPGSAICHFLALGIGGTAENPGKTYFIHADGHAHPIYISAYRLTGLNLLMPSEIIHLVNAA